MIELLIRACTISAELAGPLPPCQDFSLLFDAHEVSIMTCMVHGQAQVARWSEGHPTWRAERWQCRMLDRRESRA